MISNDFKKAFDSASRDFLRIMRISFLRVLLISQGLYAETYANDLI